MLQRVLRRVGLKLKEEVGRITAVNRVTDSKLVAMYVKLNSAIEDRESEAPSFHTLWLDSLLASVNASKWVQSTVFQAGWNRDTHDAFQLTNMGAG